MSEHFFRYIIQMADNSLILGHRLSEWCGHGPVLEQDIAMTNIALDLVGQARSLYALAAEAQNEGKTEDDLAYLRDVWDFRNLLLTEQPNGDFAHTIVRQLFFSAFQLPFYKALSEKNADSEQPFVVTLRGIAEKAIKEVTYHLRWASEWSIRLGDGTEESARRMQKAVNDLYRYTGEAFIPSETDRQALSEGYGVDIEALRPAFEAHIAGVLEEACLQTPSETPPQTGGKTGYHTEFLGYILAEMQYLQRAYPNATW